MNSFSVGVRCRIAATLDEVSSQPAGTSIALVIGTGHDDVVGLARGERLLLPVLLKTKGSR